jgi:hypothetical protein
VEVILRPMLMVSGFAVALAGALAATPAVGADERPPPIKRSITVSVPAQGMAAVPMSFTVSATPAKRLAEVTAVIQVRSRQGFTTVRPAKLDNRGKATGTIVSNRAGIKEYRAALLSAKGRVVAASTPVTVTWAPLRHSVALDCAASSAPVGVDIPCTITVTPAVRLDRMIASLEVMGRTAWVPLEAARVPTDGTLATHVAGIDAGEGIYRVRILRDARTVTMSPTVSFAYSAP